MRTRLLLVLFLFAVMSLNVTANEVTVSGFTMSPQELTINVTDSVTWTNTNDYDMLIVIGRLYVKSEIIEPGGTYTYRFIRTGSFKYTDGIGQGVGTIHVVNNNVVDEVEEPEIVVEDTPVTPEVIAEPEPPQPPEEIVEEQIQQQNERYQEEAPLDKVIVLMVVLVLLLVMAYIYMKYQQSMKKKPRKRVKKK